MLKNKKIKMLIPIAKKEATKKQNFKKIHLKYCIIRTVKNGTTRYFRKVSVKIVINMQLTV